MQGLRTLIAAEEQPGLELTAEAAEHQETWVSYPDDDPLRTFYAGQLLSDNCTAVLVWQVAKQDCSGAGALEAS